MKFQVCQNLQNKKRDVFDMHGKRIEGTIAADYRDKYPETISGIHLLSSLKLWLIIWVIKAEKMYGHEVSQPFLKDLKRSQFHMFGMIIFVI